MKMRAAVMYEQGRPAPYAISRPLVIEEVELTPPGEGEVLVEIAYAGLCHSDLSAIAGRRPRRMPAVVGHEASGIVVEIGPGVTALGPGDHVVMVFVASCGACGHCYGGRSNLCESSWESRSQGTLRGGTRHLSSGGLELNHYSGISCFAEYAVVSQNSLVRIDKDIPLDIASMFGCAVVTGVGAVVNTADIRLGATVAVIGLGGVGLSALLGARAAGATTIVAVDINEHKLALARSLGASHAVDARDPVHVEQIRSLTNGGVDFAFEMAGVSMALEGAYAMTARGGTVVVGGLPSSNATFEIPLASFVADERVIKGTYMGGSVAQRDIPRFLELYRHGRLPVEKLRSAVLGLDELNEGFDRMSRGETVRDLMKPK